VGRRARGAEREVAVIASTNTWNAYNNFGGRSNYINATSLPSRPTVNARLDLGRYNGALRQRLAIPRRRIRALSFDRPEPFNHIPKDVQLTDPIRGRRRATSRRPSGGCSAGSSAKVFSTTSTPTITPCRPARPRRIRCRDHQHASGVLVARCYQRLKRGSSSAAGS
jgi:hypothetical protein